MRASLAEALSKRNGYGFWKSLANWWLEWPCRRKAFWSQLLFGPGQGWFRWRWESRDTFPPYGEPPDNYVVAPPLRRLWFFLGGGEKWGDLHWYIDPDRKRQLWKRR